MVLGKLEKTIPKMDKKIATTFIETDKALQLIIPSTFIQTYYTMSRRIGQQAHSWYVN